MQSELSILKSDSWTAPTSLKSKQYDNSLIPNIFGFKLEVCRMSFLSCKIESQLSVSWHWHLWSWEKKSLKFYLIRKSERFMKMKIILWIIGTIVEPWFSFSFFNSKSVKTILYGTLFLKKLVCESFEICEELLYLISKTLNTEFLESKLD